VQLLGDERSGSFFAGPKRQRTKRARMTAVKEYLFLHRSRRRMRCCVVLFLVFVSMAHLTFGVARASRTTKTDRCHHKCQYLYRIDSHTQSSPSPSPLPPPPSLSSAITRHPPAPLWSWAVPGGLKYLRPYPPRVPLVKLWGHGSRRFSGQKAARWLGR
jgi:hypothetical protein